MAQSKEKPPRRPGPYMPPQFDLKTSLRQWCTCPHCLIVWDHPETTYDRGDWDWVKARYMGPTPCPQCGAISEITPRDHKRGLAKIFGNQARHLVSIPGEERGPQEPPSSSEPMPTTHGSTSQHHQRARSSREEREP